MLCVPDRQLLKRHLHQAMDLRSLFVQLHELLADSVVAPFRDDEDPEDVINYADCEARLIRTISVVG